MDISIIIVNYNVQYFIEQCLNSIYSSDFSGEMEVFVVDNDSVDASVEMIKKKFPSVRLIENSTNIGFSKANNLAINQANGKYVLILNPDTILEEDTLTKCFRKMESDTDVGVLGVHMIDGSGRFLPESKRGFPSPKVAFYKFSGISSLFRKSKKFNAYYQGHIGELETADVDILTGAFMFVRNEVFDKVGLLDEKFFMYGEDIDLSYRIKQSGFRVLYYPETSIIHFKGESTKKQTVQYTRRFYDAMSIFAEKHFISEKANTFIRSLNFVIRIKAFLSLLIGWFRSFINPLFDFGISIFTFLVIVFLWAKFYFGNSGYYDSAPIMEHAVAYSLIWVISIYYAGAYDKKFLALKVIRNIVLGTLVILAIYGLLNTNYRTSRALILLGAINFTLVVFLLRMLINFVETGKLKPILFKGKRIVLLASEERSDKIIDVLKDAQNQFRSIELLPISISNFELSELIKIRDIDEVICNLDDVGMKRIISLMAEFGDKVDFKITGTDSAAMVGSKSSKKSGEIYSLNLNYAIQEKSQRRIKRTFDIFLSLVLLVLSPLLILIGKKPKLIKSLTDSFLGKKSVVSYDFNDKDLDQLPKLKRGVIPLSHFNSSKNLHQQNLEYARDYSIWIDLRVLGSFLINKG